MEKLFGYVLAALTALATVAVLSFWPPVANAKNLVVTCLYLQRQAAGSDAELQKKADDFCKLADTDRRFNHMKVSIAPRMRPQSA